MRNAFPNAEMLIRELIRQYEGNNPLFPSANILKALAAIAGDVFGKRHARTKYLLRAHRRFGEVSHDLSQQQDYDPSRR